MYKRNCPECGKELEYKNKASLASSKCKKTLCHDCGESERREKISRGLKLAYSEGRREREFSNETREKISNTLLGNIPWNKGLTKETDNRVGHGQTKERIRYKCKNDDCNNYLECLPAHIGNRVYCDDCQIKRKMMKEQNDIIKQRKSEEYNKHKKYLDSINIYEMNGKYVRECPSCNKQLFYTQRSSCIDAEKKQRKCVSCSKKGQKPWNTGLTKEDDSRLKQSKDSIRRIRLKTLKNIEERVGQMKPNYNPSSIPIILNESKKYDIKDLQHAENGGEFHIKELGYFVDGYSEEKNIVIEYYERYHQRQKEKDLQRQKEIEEFLGCEFVIIKQGDF